MVVEVGSVPKTGQKPPSPRDNLYSMVLPVYEATGGHAIQTYPIATSLDYQKNKRIAVFSYCVFIFTPGGGES